MEMTVMRSIRTVYLAHRNVRGKGAMGNSDSQAGTRVAG